MPITRKILGQLVSAPATNEDLYEVPAARTTTCSTITATNLGTATTFRVSVAIGGASVLPEQHIYYDVPLAANDTFAGTIGITLGSGDIVRVRSASGDVAFNLFGQEHYA